MSPANRRWIISLLPALAAVAAAQRITSPASVYDVQEGESVDLPCNVEGLNKSQEVVTWMNGDRILAMDEEVVYAEDRRLDMNIEGTDYVLTIAAVKRSDSAYYQCRVNTKPIISVMHVLILPSARIKSATGTRVVYEQREVPHGRNVTVRCHGFGNPPPVLEWYRISDGTAIAIESSKKSAEHTDRAEVPNVAVRSEINGGCKLGSTDANLNTKQQVTQITVRLTRNQTFEFISDNEYQAFKMRNPEYFAEDLRSL